MGCWEVRDYAVHCRGISSEFCLISTRILFLFFSGMRQDYSVEIVFSEAVIVVGRTRGLKKKNQFSVGEGSCVVQSSALR